MTFECKICNNGFDTSRKLSKHTRDIHKIGSKAYYDTYVKTPGEDKCKFCQNDLMFVSISTGYRDSCNRCKSLKAKEFRASLKENTERHNIFVEKVRKNQAEIWKNRKETGEDKIIRQKIGQTIKSNNSALTQEELNQRFGWMNRLSEEEKERWKKEVMFQTGAHQWWKTATHTDKQELVHKRVATMTATSLQLVKEAYTDPTNWEKYLTAVQYITSMTYTRFKLQIDPKFQRSREWHLDHIYSIKAGFINNVDPFIIGSVHNLRIISAADNVKKNAKCEIALEDLIRAHDEKISPTDVHSKKPS